MSRTFPPSPDCGIRTRSLLSMTPLAVGAYVTPATKVLSRPRPPLAPRRVQKVVDELLDPCEFGLGPRGRAHDLAATRCTSSANAARATSAASVLRRPSALDQPGIGVTASPTTSARRHNPNVAGSNPAPLCEKAPRVSSSSWAIGRMRPGLHGIAHSPHGERVGHRDRLGAAADVIVIVHGVVLGEREVCDLDRGPRCAGGTPVGFVVHRVEGARERVAAGIASDGKRSGADVGGDMDADEELVDGATGTRWEWRDRHREARRPRR